MEVVLASLEGSRQVGRKWEGGVRTAEPDMVACINGQRRNVSLEQGQLDTFLHEFV